MLLLMSVNGIEHKFSASKDDIFILKDANDRASEHVLPL